MARSLHKALEDLEADDRLRVESIDLRGSELRDLSILGPLRNLEQLDLADVELTDLSGLGRTGEAASPQAGEDAGPRPRTPGRPRCPAGSMADQNPRRGDCAPAGLTACASSISRTTQVQDLRPLAGLSALQRLYLVRDPGGRPGTARRPDRLIHLYLGKTPVRDLAPLEGLTALQRLDLVGCPVSKDAVAALRAALPKATIYV